MVTYTCFWRRRSPVYLPKHFGRKEGRAENIAMALFTLTYAVHKRLVFQGYL